jgi:DNA-directed RNA polymerase specialized sigma24 family protein
VLRARTQWPEYELNPITMPPDFEKTFSADFQEALPDIARSCCAIVTECWARSLTLRDLVQDTFLKACRARDSYGGDAPLLHWLTRAGSIP